MFFENYIGDFINLQHVVCFSTNCDTLLACDIHGKSIEIISIEYSQFKDCKGNNVEMTADLCESAMICIIEVITTSTHRKFYRFSDLETEGYDLFINRYNAQITRRDAL